VVAQATSLESATQGHVTHPSRGPQKVAIAKTGRVNYTTMEDIPVVILFDSGASHDFISKAYAQKHQLVIEYMLAPYMISTPGGRIITRQVVLNPSLNLGDRVYQTCLIVLEGQGIDVILGMN
jgi:predicted aspartyl protease